MRGADHSRGLVLIRNALGGAEAAKVKVTFLIDYEVVRLEIPDDDLHRGEVFEKQDDGGSVELRVSGGEYAYLADDIIQRLARDELLEDRAVVLGVEEVVEPGDEGVVDHLQDLDLLVEYSGVVLFLEQTLLVQFPD